MNQPEQQLRDLQRVEILEAQLVASERAIEVARMLQQMISDDEAKRQIMEAFSLTELQAVTILDAQFRIVGRGARRRITEELESVRARVRGQGI